MCCEYSLEATWQGTSNEYPQYLFVYCKDGQKSTSPFKEKHSKALLMSTHNICLFIVKMAGNLPALLKKMLLMLFS